jgi:hypothetical protein
MSIESALLKSVTIPIVTDRQTGTRMRFVRDNRLGGDHERDVDGTSARDLRAETNEVHSSAQLTGLVRRPQPYFPRVLSRAFELRDPSGTQRREIARPACGRRLGP